VDYQHVDKIIEKPVYIDNIVENVIRVPVEKIIEVPKEVIIEKYVD